MLKANDLKKGSENGFETNNAMPMDKEIQHLKNEIMRKEVSELEPQLRRLYHLQKSFKPRFSGFSDYWQDREITKKLEQRSAKFGSPCEVLAARVLVGMGTNFCPRNLNAEHFQKEKGNISESAMRLANFISMQSSDERIFSIEDELAHLNECDDEDICLNTISFYKNATVNYGATPFIGEYANALIGKWLHGLLSNSIHSVIVEALKMVKKLSSLKVYMKFGKAVQTNNILTLNSFIPDPSAFNSAQASIGSSTCNSPEWIPPVYSRGAVCSIALKAFECLCRLSADHVSAFAHVFTCQDRIVEKALCYLFGSWSEDEWKAIFPGSRFLDGGCTDIYSSGCANFQHMIDGLYCEEKSIEKMISKFQLCTVTLIKIGLVKQSSETIVRCMRGDVMRRIASLLCNTTNEKLRVVAAKTLLDGWACLSSSAHIRPIEVRVREVYPKSYECLPEQLRGELKVILADACEEEGVIDVLHSHFVPLLSGNVLRAEKEERMRKRLDAKCDPKLCPVCGMYPNDGGDGDDDAAAREREEDSEREKNVKVKEKANEPQVNGILELEVEEETCFTQLVQCLDAGEMSSNEYSQYEYQYDPIGYWYVDDEDVENAYVESENEEEEKDALKEDKNIAMLSSLNEKED
ncbi:uncharacterized protein MONOS_9097 [Monocercomonoides exilis]|uniref:uncharacterized protein n=1 Tax=Monocercomonoides exilis TaxID=2049356 RepID=UPI003559CA23|nr:hypothetical protein MONOS_9097 [Monocercomonoides exilis]|eukprot:MONOS_9097.1-p1 / transcript=MONOS_9097.1 / gene=MONOS_9097 / organism=Monocercomonoides_exilis_PA203 / gene_product=unspecified product / transcript_product=unspecified product / location=Mono_scaffold00364:41821-43873(-) / protein_length=636 / sequence_SO=supercontig / SO=protein_coding / is_pseudo=false